MIKYLLYDYGRGEYLESFKLSIIRAAMVLDDRYTTKKSKALYFLTANEAVYISALIACYRREEEPLTILTDSEEP